MLPGFMRFDSIKCLRESAATESVSGEIFVCLSQREEKLTRAGKPYLDLVFVDVESSLPIKVWGDWPSYPAFAGMEKEALLAVSGVWSTGEYGVSLNQGEVRLLNPEEAQDFLSGNAELRDRQEKAWASIVSRVEALRDPRLRMWCRAFLEVYGTRFRRSGAARRVHHARRGGLVEHTEGVMRAAEALCAAYPELNKDLLVAGALFHDCGKMWENGYEEGSLTMAYNGAGELLGHLPLGVDVANSLWRRMCTAERKAEWAALYPPSEDVRLHLLHLIASHHGSLEFGSPVLPKTPEALALHHADDLDAKLEMFRSAYENSPELAPGIVQRKPPMSANAVLPLPSCNAPNSEAR